MNTNKFKAIVLIDYWQELYPKAFPKKPDPKVPLYIGIDKALMECSLAVGATPKIVNLALKLWCQGRRYYEACSKPKTSRVNLSGHNVGMVYPNQAKFANKQLTMRTY